jgi:Leucine-rich repeat (LRR) protein
MKPLYIFISLLFGVAESALAQCDTNVQRAVLHTFYDATGGANWINRSNWLTSAPVSAWFGIKTNAQGCVDSLYLNANGLSGNLPNFNLPNLTYMNLGNNQLSGRIPNLTLRSLSTMYLFNNRFSDSIPNFNLPNLKILSLNSNELTGSIPNFNLPNLTNIQLSYNRLSSSIPNFNLPRLLVLGLDDNQLSGNIPDFNFLNLQILTLFGNQLTGSLPNFNFPNLAYCNVSGNQLSGRIPNFNMPNLWWLAVNNNLLTGSVPNFQATRLQTFHFYKNNIDQVPDLSALSHLMNFRGDTNRLTFDDILPNLSRGLTYKGQDSIYEDTTFNKKISDSLIINLGIDSTIPDNVYKWFKNGVFRDSFIGNNKLIFNDLRLIDAGLYTCQVRNPRAPLLTLYSRKINIQVTCAPVQSDSSQKPLCGNRNYRLPSGKIVNRIGTFLDTVRSKVDTICDSIRYKVVLVKDSSCRCQDSLVLVALYRAAHDTVWAQDSNWLTLKPIQTWFGVRVNTQGCVDSILLYQNKLKGILPDSMGQLTQIRYLNLYDNQLTDSLRPSLGNLRQLKGLVLGKNKFTKSIPARLGNLAQLGILHLAENQLVGKIPVELGRLSQLIHLHLYKNQLTDTIPASLGDLSQLEILDLGTNQLQGRIPTELGRLVKLTTFSLRENQLTGTIPESLGNLSKVRLFFLFNNQLTGSIPQTLGRLDNLQDLELQNNRLTGSIPDSLSRLKQLSELALFNNYLSGNIPDSFSRLVKLQFLLLHHNQLTGKIPDLQRLDSLKYFEFQGNRIDSIPKLNPLTNFPNLISFRADTNQLTFDDIVPNLWRRLVYTPQDSISFTKTPFLLKKQVMLLLSIWVLIVPVQQIFINGLKTVFLENPLLVIIN